MEEASLFAAPTSGLASMKVEIASFVMGGVGCLLLFAWALQNIALLWWPKAKSDIDDLPLPPGSFGLPWIGETLQFVHALRAGDVGRFLRHRTAKYSSKTFKTYFYLNTSAVVQGVEANRFLANNENKQVLQNSWPRAVLAIMGEYAPVALHGPQHRRLRQVMGTCLSPQGLQKVIGRADAMTQHHFSTCWQAQQQVGFVSLLRIHLFRVACSLLTGVKDEDFIAFFHSQFRAWTSGMLAIPLNLPGTTYNKAKKARALLIREMRALMDRKHKDLNASQSSAERHRYEDLLSIMAQAKDESGSLLKPEELQDVLLFLLFAGHDSSTATLSFTLKFLEQNPSCYERVVQEQQEVAARKKPGEKLDWEDVHSMKYTWMVLQETMRLRPVVFGGLKEAMQDISFDGYRIPKGWKIFFNMASTHQDENIFPEPSKFDPSRFDPERLQEKVNDPPPFAYIPFGIGPHSCRGRDFARMTMSLYLHHLATGHFKWTSVDPNEKFFIFPTPSLAKGYPVIISPLSIHDHLDHI